MFLLSSLPLLLTASSHASSTEEVQHASTYGFRGEALFSLGLTSLLEIQSRCAGEESYAKVGWLHSCALVFRKKCFSLQTLLAKITSFRSSVV